MKIQLHKTIAPGTVLIEISTAQSTILLDKGVNLEENELLKLADLQDKFAWSTVKAAFLTQYHTDHITMTPGLLDQVPVYAGKLASKIALAAENYKAKKPFEFAGFYSSGTMISVGDIQITPYLVDDATYNGYLLLIEGDGERVMYTGDFRANGRKDFAQMLENLPTKIDTLICETGVLTAEDISLITERDIEEQAADAIKECKGPVFVLQSATDFDRAFTMFHAAKRNKRVFLQDLYMSQIAAAAGKAMPNPASWSHIRAYLTTGYKQEHFRYKMFAAHPHIGKTELETQKFVMCIRTSMKKYMKTLSQSIRFQNGLLINALPEYSQNTAATGAFLDFAAEKGLAVLALRTSGHANAKGLRALVDAVKPSKLLPLDSQNISWLASAYPELTVVKQVE